MTIYFWKAHEYADLEAWGESANLVSKLMNVPLQIHTDDIPRCTVMNQRSVYTVNELRKNPDVDGVIVMQNVFNKHTGKYQWIVSPTY